MMLRVLFFVAVVLVAFSPNRLVAPAVGQEVPRAADVQAGCTPPPDFTAGQEPPAKETGARPARGESSWSPCARWIFSCLREGKEVNLFANRCVRPRTREATDLYDKYKFAAVEDPDQWRGTNAIDGDFLADLLNREDYAKQLTAHGVRIVGAYFAERLNLENVTTSVNLVLDQAIFKDGLRLNNFESPKNVSLDKSNLRGTALMNRMRLSGSLFMEDGVYDRVDLRDARIGASLDASGSFFVGTVRLDRAHIDGKVNFVKSRLTEVSGWDLVVGGSFWLRNADVRGRIDLTGARLSGDLRMQKVTFGRATTEGAETCDWDLAGVRKLFLDDVNTLAGKPRLDAVMKEVLDKRPMHADAADMCVNVGASPTPVAAQISANAPVPGVMAVRAAVFAPSSSEAHLVPADSGAAPEASVARQVERKRHEVRLRDMTIGGTLCLIDLTGEVKRAGEPSVARTASGAPDDPSRVSEWAVRPGREIESISIDGTQARSTIIRWTESDSLTLWHAVQFKTDNMLLDLGAQPRRHFIDNLDVSSVSFISTNRVHDPSPLDEDFYPYLCDMRPGAIGGGNRLGAGEASDSRAAHERIVKFFTLGANESRSVQPFAKIAERLQESGASSMYLKMELGDFAARKTCSSSEVFKEYERDVPETWAMVSPHFWQAVGTVWSSKVVEGWRGWIGETKNVTLDAGCRGLFKAYKYTAAYGHQPHNVFIVIAIFVLLFRLLLLLDVQLRPEVGGAARSLGMLYAIDMFVPFVKLNAEHATMQPHRPALRGYLILHRVLGLILTSLLVLGLYVQKH